MLKRTTQDIFLKMHVDIVDHPKGRPMSVCLSPTKEIIRVFLSFLDVRDTINKV